MMRLTALLVVAMALTACATLPSERQLVGTWRMPERTTQNEFGITQWRSKEMAEFTIRSDHTYTWGRQGHRPDGVGRWRLSGRWLLSEFEYRKKGRMVTESNRNHILKLSDQQLVFPDDNVWTRVR